MKTTGKMSKCIEDGITANIKHQVDMLREVAEENADRFLGLNFDLLMHTLACVTGEAIDTGDTTRLKTVLGWDDTTDSDFKEMIQEIKNTQH